MRTWSSDWDFESAEPLRTMAIWDHKVSKLKLLNEMIIKFQDCSSLSPALLIKTLLTPGSLSNLNVTWHYQGSSEAGLLFPCLRNIHFFFFFACPVPSFCYSPQEWKLSLLCAHSGRKVSCRASCHWNSLSSSFTWL